MNKKYILNNIVVAVDVQNDFIDGPLGKPENVEITNRIKEFLESIKDRKDTIILGTMDTHQKAELYLNTHEGKNLPIPHCEVFQKGWESPIGDLYEQMVHKDTFMADHDQLHGIIEFTAEGNNMMMNDKPTIYLCGFCTSICVISNALLFRQMYPESEIYIIDNLCGDINTESHLAALTVATNCQIGLMGAADAKTVINLGKMEVPEDISTQVRINTVLDQLFEDYKDKEGDVDAEWLQSWSSALGDTAKELFDKNK